jgi:ATP-dependent Lhr-like helicase
MVDVDFLQAIDSGVEHGSFVLAGRPWEIVTVEWERGICVVRPGADGRAPRWSGAPRHLSYELCQAMRRVLVSDTVDPSWSKRATTVLTTMRAEHAFLRNEVAPIRSTGPEELTWWTYAGGGANALLGRMVEAELGERAICRNTSVKLVGGAARSDAAVRELIFRWARQGRPTEEDARQHAAGAVRGRVSKFQPCLPEELLRDLLVRSVLDVEGARTVVAAAAGR